MPTSVPEPEPHASVRKWIEDIIDERSDVLRIAVSQRAKFEGWLKFELACVAARNGATNVRVEAPLQQGRRADLAFELKGRACCVELKTPNTNYRMKGIEDRSRPITRNIAGIVADAQKLRSCGGGVIAFVLFPIKPDDTWLSHLRKIGEDIEQELVAETHALRKSIKLIDDHSANVGIVTFDVPSADTEAV